jgi:DNA-binding response OmpR family regulator
VSAPPPLLVVEDDLILRTTLQTVLSHVGYQVVAASNGQQAINQLHTQPFTDPFGVIVSDIQLGDLDGLQVLSTARALPQPPEVILITGHSTIASAVQALRFGAFDYLTKPVAMSELLPTITRALERYASEQRRMAALTALSRGLELLQQPAETMPNVPAPPRSDRYIQLDLLQIDTFTHNVTYRGKLIHLTPTEYLLLTHLALRPGYVCTYTDLAQQLYQQPLSLDQARSLLKSHIAHLRAKLPPDSIQAVRGVGYRFNPASTALHSA